MTPEEMKQLAKLLQNMPGLKAVELKDVTRLAALLRESPDIGSIEVKGLFGTGVVITRTAATGPALIASPLPVAASVALPAPSSAPAAEAPPPAPAPSTLKDIRSPMDFEQMAKLVRPEDFDGRMLISSDLEAHRKEIQKFADMGFDKIYLHNVGRNQRQWIDVFGRDVLPKLVR